MADDVDLLAARAGLDVLVAQLARATPVPAGGAAAASAVAQGSALLAKCARIGARGLAQPPSIAALDAMAAEAVALFVEDCEAFVAVSSAPKGDARRRHEAWARAIGAPLELAALALDAAEWVPTVRAAAREATRPDVDAAAALLSTGVSISHANARANLARLPEGEPHGEMRARLAELEARARRSEALRHLGDAVREACARAAEEAFREGGYSGLCEDGRIELALDAIRNVSVADLVVPRRPPLARVPKRST